MSRKEYQPWTPKQSFLLPPSPLEWLPEGHLAYFVLEVVEQLDLAVIEAAIQAKDPRGQRPYAPRMMVALLLYAYCVGVFSSRRIERATHDDVAFRVLAAGEHPHFTTLNQFRLDHRAALAALFLQVLKLCRKAGLVKLGLVALDGTKVQANASKHKAMSYARMQAEEGRLRDEIEGLLGQADQADQQDDARYGKGVRPEDVPEELQRREARLKRIQQAKTELEQEAAQVRAQELRARAEAERARAADPALDASERKRAATRGAQKEEQAAKLARDRDDDEPPSEGGRALPSHRVPTTPEGTPTPKAQRNFTDPESRIMVQGGAFVQAYNAQAVVDSTAQVIVATAVTNQPPDQEHLGPLLARCIANCDGDVPAQLLADAGYFSLQNVAACEARGVDAFLAVSRKNAEAKAAPTTAAGQVREQMRQKLTSEPGRAIYARRKTIAEPPFGQIKAARGFRRFSFRGVVAAGHEWSLVATCHNLLKLFRATFLQVPRAAHA